jgi:hypothetical protein
MNPIKSPQEMLFQQAGIPALAGGGAPEQSPTKLDRFIEFFKREYGRDLLPHELEHVRIHFDENKKPVAMEHELIAAGHVPPRFK